jgi:uncharacterized lipoprotein YmbA
MTSYQMKSMSNGLRSVNLHTDWDNMDKLNVSIGMWSGGDYEPAVIDMPKRITDAKGDENDKRRTELENEIMNAVIEVLKEADDKILRRISEVVADFDAPADEDTRENWEILEEHDSAICPDM